MKIRTIAALAALALPLCSEVIQYSNHSIIYGIGEASFSGIWMISASGNNFSGQQLCDLYENTQIWILHHPLTVILDEGDSLLHYDYAYRYYKKNDPVAVWRYFEPVFSDMRQHDSGYWYCSGYLDYTSLLDLPLDTGDYYLEFRHSADIAKQNGDTLTYLYLLPDSQDFKAGFSVLPLEQTGTEGGTPVTWSYVRSRPTSNGVVLEWGTASETENSHFLIYRDGEVIGRVDGHGTTTEQHDYSYPDTQVPTGNHRYTIADVTYGGVEGEVEVEVEAEIEVKAGCILEKAYPNPFNPDTRIDYYMSRRVHLRLDVYNLQGEKVANLYNGIREAGTHSAIWNATGFPSGIYVVRMISEGMLQTMKIVLMK
jgi:hypothetical protein